MLKAIIHAGFVGQLHQLIVVIGGRNCDAHPVEGDVRLGIIHLWVIQPKLTDTEVMSVATSVGRSEEAGGGMVQMCRREKEVGVTNCAGHSVAWTVIWAIYHTSYRNMAIMTQSQL